jgi:hypothetical protein
MTPAPAGLIPENFSVKSFWARPEGTLGMVVAVILGGLALYGVGMILPFLITLFSNVLYLVALGFAIVVLATILTSKRFWTLFFGSFKLIMRFVTSIFITIDPIGILKNYVDSLAEHLADIGKQIQNLRGQMGQLKVTIETNKSEAIRAATQAKAAKEKGKQAAFVLSARSFGRLKNSNVTLEQLYAKLDGLMRMLNKMKEVSEFMFQDIKENVTVLERQKNAIDAGYRAMRSAMKFISDASDDKVLYDQTVEYLINDYGQKLGEIEQFMEVATPFIESTDIQNGVFEEDALKQLEAWEKKADNLLLGDTKQLLLAGGEELSSLLDMPELAEQRVPVAVSNQQSQSQTKFLKK